MVLNVARDLCGNVSSLLNELDVKVLFSFVHNGGGDRDKVKILLT